MLLVAIVWSTQNDAKTLRITRTLSNGYSSESYTQRELSNEYQHDRVKMDFKNLCVLIMLRTKGALALEGLRHIQYEFEIQ